MEKGGEGISATVDSAQKCRFRVHCHIRQLSTSIPQGRYHVQQIVK